jgi:hypothetical protein
MENMGGLESTVRAEPLGHADDDSLHRIVHPNRTLRPSSFNSCDAGASNPGSATLDMRGDAIFPAIATVETRAENKPRSQRGAKA